MGLFAIFGLGTYAFLLALSFGAVVASLARCRASPLYWLFSLTSGIGLPVFLYRPFHTLTRSDHGWVGALFDTMWSGWSVLLLFGALVGFGLAIDRRAWLRPLAGVSWGFAAILVVRLVEVFSGLTS